MANRERLIKLGWRQGILLAPVDERLKQDAHYDIKENDQLLIVSQTCDLVQGSFENEPWFEVLCLHPLGREPDRGYLGGKNSRRIEFNMTLAGDGPGHWYALPYERHLISRALLMEEGLGRAASIDGQILKMVLAWLSRRYTRAAFPEAFVRRMDARREPISNKFSRLNTLVTNVYIRLTPFEELTGDDEYAIELMLIMDAEVFDDEKKYRECSEITGQLENQLKKCPSILVDDIRIESTASVTLENLSGYREWDYSYLSFRDPDNAAAPLHT